MKIKIKSRKSMIITQEMSFNCKQNIKINLYYVQLCFTLKCNFKIHSKEKLHLTLKIRVTPKDASF